MPDWLLWAFAIFGMLRVGGFILEILIKVIRNEAKEQILKECRNFMGKRW